MKKQKLMTVAQYAAKEKVTPKTIYQWIKDTERKIKTVKVGNITLIDLSK